MINYDYMRPIKAERLKPSYDGVEELTVPLNAESYKNAILLPGKILNGKDVVGGLVDKNDDFVEESRIYPDVFGGYYDYEIAEYKDEKVVFCGYFKNHWGHFLVEVICRLWYFLKNDKTIDKYVFVVDENEERVIKGNFKEFFVLLGVWDKLELVNKPIQYREVVLPQRGCQRPIYYSKEYKSIFDYIASKVKVDPSWEKADKIFFTRSQLKSAEHSDIANEMLDNYFDRNGFKIVAPEKESLSYQIFLMQNASEFACISGSLALNLMFAKDESKVLMMERLVATNEYTVLTNSAKNFDVVHIDSYIGIYTTDLASGPYMSFYKGYLEKYTNDNNMRPPDDKYISKSYEKKCYQKYMKIYKKAYGYSWYMYDWEEKNIGAYRECYKDSLIYFGDYIYGLKPFKLSHYFELRYIKQAIKRIIRK